MLALMHFPLDTLVSFGLDPFLDRFIEIVEGLRRGLIELPLWNPDVWLA